MIGFNPKMIPYLLSPVPEHMDRCAAKTVENAEARFLAHPETEDYLASRIGWGQFKWDKDFREIPASLLLKVFSFEECTRFWVDSVIESKLSKYIEKEHNFLWKLQNTHWRFGMHRGYNLIPQHLESLKQLNFDLPDFDTRLVYTVGCCTSSYTEQLSSLFLDASWGLLIYYKGEHVLTVGFAPSQDGILIAQIQLRQKKGNRFLYKLPKHYMDCVLDMFQAAFPTERLLLVEGRSAADACKRSHVGTDLASVGFTPETEKRIETIYNRRLDKFTRDKDLFSSNGRAYYPLQQVA